MASKLQVLVLLTVAFGGYRGISRLNGNFLVGLGSHRSFKAISGFSRPARVPVSNDWSAQLEFINQRTTDMAIYSTATLSGVGTDCRALRYRFWLCVFTLILLSATSKYVLAGIAETVAEEIRYEATLPNNSPIGRPLPLAASWNTGVRPNALDPDYQLAMIEKGHFLLPWFQLDMPKGRKDVKNSSVYYQNALTRSGELGLPISFISTQWERPLSDDAHYLTLPRALNPNVIKADGSVAPMVSPFGPVQPWTDVGYQWTAASVVRRLQNWYPNPPLVVFVSNNEHPKLKWQDADLDVRYLTFNNSKTDEAKRKSAGQGWIDRYRALQAGMRSGLRNSAWKQNAIFVGYNAFGGLAFGRWGRWINYSLAITERIEPWPLAWDGASPSFYVHDWDNSTDFTAMSPLIGSMNWVFMLEDAYRLNPNFWLELSVWDGHRPRSKTSKRAYYARLGQSYSPDRYAGMVKFGMWLLRPRVIREFRFPEETRNAINPYFTELIRAVDNIHHDPVLKEFWRNGILLPNKKRKHPYQEHIPAEYAMKDRWFLLDTDLDPKRPWNLSTEIPVFTLALEKGVAPDREWLIVIHSPLGDRADVEVTVPGYGGVRVSAAPKGSYYHLYEVDGKIEIVGRL